ncbi:AMP-binding protein [Sulfitobacter guttiformis]|uniref:4-coumarate--CoA ligase n=1 Tax=Sulfitobacter guttiformis TaxID=74349 RepID=A0A420DNA8_9RHOB|nr:AMP-binding protein [Sulfitobacter guttiformis]KIN73046.1 4-coumarate:CoA ligase [Sulfitobacter guttiformis KCTC 32187]RKE95732.1 4-coumarate--CoA ligase [Sulfitobacter guttiformis]
MTYKTAAADIALRDQSITERVFESLEARPDEVVLTDGTNGSAMTAAEFMAQVKQLAGGLTARGMGAGKVVALMSPNIPHYCVVFHAVAWAGGTITTINPTYTASEVAHQLRDSAADILITIPMFLETAQAGAKDAAGQTVVVVGDAPEGIEPLSAYYGAPIEAQVPVDLDAHSVVLPYSSGTTGLPKGVRLSHRNLVVNVDQIIENADFQKGEVAAAFLPFFHIYGMNVLMNVHLAGGGALVTMPRFDLELFLQISQDYKARRMWIVPPVALALAKHPIVDNYDLSNLEQIFSGAAPLGGEVSDAVGKRLNCMAVQGYGMTELSPVSHTTPLEKPKSGSSGVALPNTLCRIVDPTSGEDLPAGKEGELWIKGPQVMKGYLNNEKATKETLTEDGWLKTGDIAYIDEEGYMFIMDRLKELIKFKGFQVAPAELEANLVTHPSITDAAVIGIPDDEAGELPIAFVVTNDADLTLEAIQTHMAKTLSKYKLVQKVMFVEEIPKSASGKILRRVLKAQIS